MVGWLVPGPLASKLRVALDEAAGLLKVDCDVNERPQVLDYDENSVQARRNHHTFVLALQQVYWHYREHLCPKDPALPLLGLREFVGCLLEQTPEALPFAWLGFAPALCAHSQYVVDRLLRSHEDIAQTAPVIGTIVLDSSLQYCLLVTGPSTKGKWSFPKGAKLPGERSVDGAAREVATQTGLEVRQLMTPSVHFERTFSERPWIVFVASKVAVSTPLQPQLLTDDIHQAAWWSVAHLYKRANNEGPRNTTDDLLMVLPFMWRLAAAAEEARAAAAPSTDDTAAAEVFVSSHAQLVRYSQVTPACVTSTAVAEEQRAGASEDREGAAAAAAAAAADAARAKRMVSRGKGSRKVEEVANAEDYEHSPTEVVRVLVWQQPDESAGTLSSDATAGADGAVGTPVEGSVQRVSYNMLCKSQLTQFCSKRRLPAPVFKLLPPPESSSGPPQYEATATLHNGKEFRSGVHPSIKEAQWCCGTAALDYLRSLPADSPELQRSPNKKSPNKSPPKPPASPRNGHARSGSVEPSPPKKARLGGEFNALMGGGHSHSYSHGYSHGNGHSNGNGNGNGNALAPQRSLQFNRFSGAVGPPFVQGGVQPMASFPMHATGGGVGYAHDGGGGGGALHGVPAGWEVIGPAGGSGIMMGMDGGMSGMNGMHTVHAMQNMHNMQSMHNLQAMQMHGLNGNGMHAMAAMPNSLPQPMQMAFSYAEHALMQQQQQQQQQQQHMGMGMGMTAMDAFNPPAFARPPQPHFGHHHSVAPLPHGSRQQPSSPRPPQPPRPLRANSPAPPPPKLTPLPIARRSSPAPLTANPLVRPSTSSSTAAAASPSPPASPHKPVQATLSPEETQALLRRDREIARRLQELTAAPKWPVMMMCLLQQHSQRLPTDKACLASAFQKANLDPPRYTNMPRGMSTYKATAELWNGHVVESIGRFRTSKEAQQACAAAIAVPLRALALQQSGNAHLFHAVGEELADRSGDQVSGGELERQVLAELGVRHCDLPTLDATIKSARTMTMSTKKNQLTTIAQKHKLQQPVYNVLQVVKSGQERYFECEITLWTNRTLRSTQCQTAKESQQQAAQAALEHLTATVAELKARLDKSSPSPRADSAGAMHLFARDRK